MYALTDEGIEEPSERCSGLAERVTEGETILFVEDEAFVREVTCEVLRAAGYSVVAAKNAGDAARSYDDLCGDVDLLLTDVVLPGETGRALAGRLRRQNPRLKVLFVTGYGDQMGLRSVEGECLAKPFSTGVLLGRVRQLLDQEEFRVGKRCLAMPTCGSA